MYANVIESDVWEWALTSIAGAHQAAGPAGHALRSLAKDSCCGVLQGSPEGVQHQLFLPDGWRISTEISSPSS